MASEQTEPTLRAVVNAARSEARLHLDAEMIREQLTVGLCQVVLKEAGVEFTRAVEKAVTAFVAAAPPQGTPAEAAVAQATPPVAGRDAVLNWLVHEPGDEAEDTSFYERRGYVEVKAGEVVAQLTPETEGKDGRDVAGNTLAAKAGKPCQIRFDESLLIDAQGKIVSQLDGVLVRTAETARVTRLLEVPDYVDFSIGNIDFDGDVQIRKGVRDRFEVKATGSVEIAGLVEAATIMAAGNLTLLGGAAGREQGRLHVGGTLEANYLHGIYAEVDAALVVRREIINSQLTVHGEVRSDDATFIGGTLTVVGPATLGTVGSPGGVKTHLVLGTVPRDEEMFHRVSSLIKRLANKHKTMIQEQEELASINGAPSAQQRERQTEITYELEHSRRDLDSAIKGQALLRKRIEAARTIDLHITRQLHAGTVLIGGEQRYHIRQAQRGPVRITAAPTGELLYQQGNGKPQPLIGIADVQSDPCTITAAS